jgi:hypothetical protein
MQHSVTRYPHPTLHVIHSANLPCQLFSAALIRVNCRLPKSASSLMTPSREEEDDDDEEKEDDESTPVINSLTSPIEEGLPTAPLQEPGGEGATSLHKVRKNPRLRFHFFSKCRSTITTPLRGSGRYFTVSFWHNYMSLTQRQEKLIMFILFFRRLL